MIGTAIFITGETSYGSRLILISYKFFLSGGLNRSL